MQRSVVCPCRPRPALPANNRRDAHRARAATRRRCTRGALCIPTLRLPWQANHEWAMGCAARRGMLCTCRLSVQVGQPLILCPCAKPSQLVVGLWEVEWCRRMWRHRCCTHLRIELCAKASFARCVRSVTLLSRAFNASTPTLDMLAHVNDTLPWCRCWASLRSSWL